MNSWSKCFVACLSLLASSCSESGFAPETPRTSISILVDLSGTWHAEQFERRNLRLLRAVSRGVAIASNQLPENAWPVSYSYLSIGDATFLDEPICSATFRPQLISSSSPENFVTNLEDLTHLLSASCTELVLGRPPEQMTDITAGIVSASRGQALSSPDTEIVIILSDFYEQRRSTYQLSEQDVTGRSYLLLYRDIGDDPSILDERVRDWTSRLEALGGQVLAVSDTNITEQDARLSAFIVETVEASRRERRN